MGNPRYVITETNGTGNRRISNPDLDDLIDQMRDEWFTDAPAEVLETIETFRSKAHRRVNSRPEQSFLGIRAEYLYPIPAPEMDDEDLLLTEDEETLRELGLIK